MVNVLRIHPRDNVVVALTELPAGTDLELGDPEDGSLHITSQSTIPFGHKVAIRPIARGQTVIKYGASIGVAVEDIVPGQHVHTHNLRSVRGAARS